ncbi:MAG: hypothetical protein JSS75_00185 [Bacteroidetes bacterium]|nr:hypothetical protein [Bacteroidota bacterium]
MKKQLFTALVVALGFAGAASAQTYKPDYATKVVLAGSGTDLTKTISLVGATPGTAVTYTLPDKPASSGYILASTTGGTMSWVDPTSVSSAWNLTGNASGVSNFIGTTDATNPFVIKTNSATRISIGGTGTINVAAFGTGIVHSSSTGDLSSSPVSLTADVSGILPPANGGTGVNNGSNTITLGGNMSTGGTFSTTGTFSSGGNFSTTGTFSTGGNFSTSNAFTTTTGPITLNAFDAGGSNVTLPASGTLLAAGGAGSFSTLTSTGNSTIGTSSSATNNSFGTGANANSVINTIGSTGTGSMTTINGGVTLGALNTAGVVHTDASGVLSTTLIVNADITNGTIANAKLANSSITFGSTGSTLTSSGSVSLGGTVNYDIDLTHANNWTGKQTITGAGNFMYVDGFQAAGYVLTSDASGNAKWASLSGLGITSVVGTSPINVNTVSGTATVSITHADLTADATTTGLSVTGGTGAVIGSGASVSLAHDATLKVATSQLGIDLGHSNTWTADQLLPTSSSTQADNIVAVLNNSTTALGVTHGGTGTTTAPTQGGVAFGVSTSALGYTAAGTAGQVLQSNGTSTPTWVNAGATTTYASSTTNNIAGATNNFAISSTQTVYYLQNSTASPQNLTGVVAGASGRLIILINNGPDPIVLKDKNAGSTAANQFHLQGASDIILGVDGTVTLVYDPNASNSTGTGAWRVVANY